MANRQGVNFVILLHDSRTLRKSKLLPLSLSLPSSKLSPSLACFVLVFNWHCSRRPTLSRSVLTPLPFWRIDHRVILLREPQFRTYKHGLVLVPSSNHFNCLETYILTSIYLLYICSQDSYIVKPSQTAQRIIFILQLLLRHLKTYLYWNLSSPLQTT